MGTDDTSRLAKVEQRLAVCYVALMFCAAIIIGFVIHELNLPALCH